MSYEAKDLIERLLTEDPDQRAGSNGAEEVKRHPFFAGVNWGNLLRLKGDPTFVPQTEGDEDTSYFEERGLDGLKGAHDEYDDDHYEDYDDSRSASASGAEAA
eukprot:762175-Prorocentrum_minimum.AAC.3